MHRFRKTPVDVIILNCNAELIFVFLVQQVGVKRSGTSVLSVRFEHMQVLFVDFFLKTVSDSVLSLHLGTPQLVD